MKTKTIEKIISPSPTHMVGNGFIVHNFLPGALDNDTRMSPFFLLDYNAETYFPPSEKPFGIGPHPHRGIETVTFAYQGKVAHHDSYGNSGVIGEGDLQWMTAGSGVLHKEYHEKEFNKKGGLFQMVQLWLNLPKKDKMTNPHYQAITNDKIPVVSLPDNSGILKVVAGSYNGLKGIASSFTPIEIYQIQAKKGAVIDLNLPENYNTGILVLKGSVKINNQHIAPTNHFALFENKGTEINLHADEDMTLLVLSGEPIQELIFPYGPFVMNTREEIVQAYNDLEEGKFGILEN